MKTFRTGKEDDLEERLVCSLGWNPKFQTIQSGINRMRICCVELFYFSNVKELDNEVRKLKLFSLAVCH